MCAVLAAGALALPATAQAGRGDKKELEKSGFYDPRTRQPPPTHRFRIGLTAYYVRLSAALDPETQEAQRFHYSPVGVDFAYQAQFARWLMLRPSLTFGLNPANTWEAMPMLIHPQLHFGYQGQLIGVAFGYGWWSPPVQRKDAVSEVRGGLGQPIVTNNHHFGGEVSFTTRIDSGALSVWLRLHGVKSRTQHFDLDNKRWRPLLMAGVGWYFGDGSRQRRRQAERRANKRRRDAE